MSILISVLGMIVLIAIALLMSNNRRSINLRTVVGAFALQFLIGAFILYVPTGQKALGAMSSAVAKVLEFGNAGIEFLFGGLMSDKMFEVFGGGGFIFALRVLPVIVFFSSLVAVLYYLGVMQWFVKLIGGGLQKILGTSKPVSMSAAANIFVGQTEAPLVVKPYISRMSESDLFAVMCGGLASIAGSVLAGYAGMGVPLPYLIAASFMAAPGGLLFAKLIMPETEEVKEIENFEIAEDDTPPANVLDAAAEGAITGMQMAMNVGAMLIAFIGLIALLNGIIGGVGGWFGYGEITLQQILGYIFAPLAWVIGTPWSEAQTAGSLIGQKVVVNEFVAYAEYTNLLKEGTVVLSDKTQAIISFALCGFANLSSIAILIGGLGVIAPNRRHDIARLGIKAVIAGSLSNLMSATIAGLFIGLSGAAALGVGV
ncbi:NupC/NupG family nucleoside CNT transporter [Psychrobacter sp. HD31]|uniref:NupC/NupG family nucleoside CNT transporter n=1 Tax=Psychrobacter sp. HD31 TaxID=3112003 RepID=UPI003DA4B2AA